MVGVSPMEMIHIMVTGGMMAMAMEVGMTIITMILEQVMTVMCIVREEILALKDEEVLGMV